MTPSALPRLAVACTAVLALGACAGADRPEPVLLAHALTEPETREALIQPEHVGPDFEWHLSSRIGDVDEEGPAGLDLGCLGDLRGLGDVGPADDDLATAEVSLTAANGTGLPAIVQSVGSEASQADARVVFDQVRRVVGSCTDVETDTAGVRLRLKVTSDRRRVAEVVDEELNFAAKGRIRQGGRDLPFAVYFTAVRVANHAIVTGLVAHDVAADDLVDRLTAIGVSRLVAILDGDEPPAVRRLRIASTVPAGGPESDESDETAG